MGELGVKTRTSPRPRQFLTQSVRDGGLRICFTRQLPVQGPHFENHGRKGILHVVIMRPQMRVFVQVDVWLGWLGLRGARLLPRLGRPHCLHLLQWEPRWLWASY